MTGQVDANAAVSLAFTAYDAGVKSVRSEPERIRMQIAAGVPFDLIVHGEITSARLIVVARLLEACAAIMEAPATSPAETDSPGTEPPSGEVRPNQTGDDQ